MSRTSTPPHTPPRFTGHRRHVVGCIGLGLLVAAVGALVVACTTHSVHHRTASHESGAVGSPMGIHAGMDARSGAPVMPLLEGPFDEIWVLAREQGRRAPQPASRRTLPKPHVPTDEPQAAVLLAEFAPAPGAAADAPPRRIPLPLTRTEVEGSVAGPIVSATMRQRYQNPFDAMIEAVYVFPLPHDAAVADFVMVVGDRRIRGLIRERAEAEQTYVEARRAGHVASLLTEERPNIFTQRVANIEPGKTIDIDITFYGTVSYDEGWHEVAIPLVVGPRFTPGGYAPPPERGVVARPRTAPAEAADRIEVRYLEPGETSDHRVSMRWTIDAGTPIHELKSPTHRVTTEQPESGHAVVTLSEQDGHPDRDFVLRWRVGGSTPTTSLVSSSASAAGNGGAGGHFVLTIYPPAEAEFGERVPLEVIVVIDRSGSMRGIALAQTKEMAKTIIGRLAAHDTFTIVEFSQTAEVFAPLPVAATDDAKRRASEYVNRLQAGGGTHLLRGMTAALEVPRDEERQRHVILLTDGFIGNEVEVLSSVHRQRGGARISSIGSGGSVNRFLIAAMSQVGEGTSGVLLPDESASDAARLLIDRLSRPIMAGLTIESDQPGTELIEIDSLFPRRLPDLHAGRPVTVIGRTRHAGPASLTLAGWVGSQQVRVPLHVDFAGTADATALDRLWARAAIAEVTRQAWCGEVNDAPHRIRTIALNHGLLSPFTAFVAVDGSRTVDHERGTIVQQAVPVPVGVEYEATVASPVQ